MQSVHFSRHLCVTPDRLLWLQASQIYRLDIAPV